MTNEQQEALTQIWEYMEETQQHLDKDGKPNEMFEAMGLLKPLTI